MFFSHLFNHGVGGARGFLTRKDGGFSLQRFFASNAVYAFFNVSMLVIVLIPYLRSKNFNPLQLSTISSVKEIATFFFMYLGGILFDKVGPRKAFLIGRIMDMLALCLVLSGNLYVVLLSMVVCGAGYGVTYGKYTSYIYNVLSMKGKLNVYARFSAGFYFVWDIAITFMGFVSTLLLKNHSYDFLIYVSIGLKFLAIISILILIPKNNDKNYDFQQFKSESVKEIFSIVMTCAKKNTLFVYLIIFYGLLQFITWDLAVKVGDFAFLDLGWTPQGMAKYATYLSALMASGTFIPMLFFPNGISLNKSVILTLVEAVLFLMASIFYNDKMLLASFVLLCATFTTFEVSVEKNFEKVSNKKIRGTAISVSISIGTILTVINTMLVGTLAQYFNYHIGFITVGVLMVVMCGWLCVKIYNNTYLY